MAARLRLDSGISTGSLWSDTQFQNESCKSFDKGLLENKNVGPSEIESIDFMNSFTLDDGLKAVEFGTGGIDKPNDVCTKKKGDNDIVYCKPVSDIKTETQSETHRQNHFEHDTCKIVADNSHEKEVKQIDDINDLNHHMLQPPNCNKNDLIREKDLEKSDKFKIPNRIVEKEGETKSECEQTNQNCNLHNFRNTSVCSDSISSVHTCDYIDQRLSSFLTIPDKLCNVPSTINKAYIDVTRRCDDLLNELQQMTLKYASIKEMYLKIKKLFYILAVINLILMICMLINLPVLIARLESGQSNSAAPGDSAKTDSESAYGEGTICFNCSDLNSDTTYSLETLTDVRQENGICCFQSIVSVIRSIGRNVQTALEESLQVIKTSITKTEKSLLALEAGSIPDISKVIGRILQALSPKEKSVVYLRSVKDTPVVMDQPFTDKYNKLKWDRNDAVTILTDGVDLSRNGLNIVVKSEGYYFIYTKIQFRQRKKFTYQNVPLSYLIYRKRGSTSTYVHEAKLNCIFNGKTQEHSSNSEMVLYLNRDDEIFLSVGDLDKYFLSMYPGVHSIGLFEL